VEAPPELGPFAPTAVLGEGGSGIVYAARWDGRMVALKVARPELPLTTKEQQRFLHEARLMARVRHPAVVEVLDAGVLPDGRAYLAMTLLEGETLAERLATRGALPVAEAAALFFDLADAAATLHDEGLVHRDLKPENVMLVDGGRRVKLLDFGIAKELSAPASTTTQSGLARGTPATMAPERFFGAPASASTDVYELALVLYAMVVGTLPWPDATNVDVRLNPRSPREAGADVPDALSTTILRALSTRPERRPASARALADEVRAALTPVAPGHADARVTQATPSHAPPPVVEDESPPELAPVSSQRAAAGRTSDKTQVKDVVPVQSAPRRGRAALLALGAALAAAGAFALARASASTSADAIDGQLIDARTGFDSASAATGTDPEGTVAAASPQPSSVPSAEPTSRPSDPAAKSTASAAATPAAKPAGRPPAADAKAKPTSSATPPPTSTAAELPGGVYDKPPY
jgi:serine/threonine-protein kinase